jgi:hypothetical protein
MGNPWHCLFFMIYHRLLGLLLIKASYNGVWRQFSGMVECNMKLWTRFIIVVITSISLAWLLSFLPDLQSELPAATNELQVFHHEDAVTLTEKNIVDWIITVPLQMKLMRVDWSDRILSVDFEVGKPLESSRIIYNQLLDFVYYGLGATTNVDRVWVRIMQASGSEANQPKRLLIALDANREQISEDDYERWKNQLITAEHLIHTRFQLTLTPQWTKIRVD